MAPKWGGSKRRVVYTKKKKKKDILLSRERAPEQGGVGSRKEGETRKETIVGNIYHSGSKSEIKMRERKTLMSYQDEVLKKLGLYVEPEPLSTNPKTIKARRYYVRKRLREGKIYIPRAIRLKGQFEAKKEGYNDWVGVDRILRTEKRQNKPAWEKNLSSEEQQRLYKMRKEKAVKALAERLKETLGKLFRAKARPERSEAKE